MKNNELLKVVGAFCRNARKNANITIKQMAEISGYSAGTITQFEQGLNNNLCLYLTYERTIYEKGIKG